MVLRLFIRRNSLVVILSELSVEDNAKAIEPGFDMMTPKQQKDVLDEVSGVEVCWGLQAVDHVIPVCVRAQACCQPLALPTAAASGRRSCWLRTRLLVMRCL